MSEERKFDFFSRDESLVDVFESLFAPKGYGIEAVFKVFVGIMSIGWLADSLLPFLHGWALIIFQSPSAEGVNFTDTFYQFVFALLWFVLYIGLVFLLRRRKVKIGKFIAQASFPHRGLIVSLSNYGGTLSLEDLEKAIDERTLDVEGFYNSANWGQLAFTISHHSYLLSKCWLCTTPKSSAEFPVAAKLINYISQKSGGRQIVCDEIELKDENDISEMARKVSRIYRDLEGIESTLKPADVISNYTGGTAAMSGGMIMATLNKHRKIEYVTQKYFRNLSDELLKNNDKSLAIVSSETNIQVVQKLN